MSYSAIMVLTKEKRYIAVECDSCHVRADVDDTCKFQSFADFKLSFGFGSKHDLEVHRFQLCEPCYDRMLATMRIAPCTTEYMAMQGDEITEAYPAE